MSNTDPLLSTLQVYQIPAVGKTLRALNAQIELTDHQLRVRLGCVLGHELQQQVSQALSELAGRSCELEVSIPHYAVQANLTPHPQIKNLIAVGSGKGGVGKSTTAANLALALQQLGAQVGVLDADIYGPNQPQLLGAAGQQPVRDDAGKLYPVVAHGLQTMSIGYLIDDDTPMVWRGPMVSTALQQLLRDTLWQDLDYLIVDLPPGTGDVQLTMAQKLPVSGVVVVTTPQDIALADVRKAVKMFDKVELRQLGVVENMSVHTCGACGHQESVFGVGGAARLASEQGLTVLGELPLDASICEQGEQGVPAVVAAPTEAIAEAYLAVARQVSAELCCGHRDYGHKFPNVVVETK